MNVFSLDITFSGLSGPLRNSNSASDGAIELNDVRQSEDQILSDRDQDRDIWSVAMSII